MNEQVREKIRKILVRFARVWYNGNIMVDIGHVVNGVIDPIAALMPKPLDVEVIEKILFDVRDKTIRHYPVPTSLIRAQAQAIAARFCAPQYDRNAIVCELLQSKLDNAFVDYQNARITKRKLIEHIADAVESAPVEAGTCNDCGGPVYHRPGKPGEFDHECKAAPVERVCRWNLDGDGIKTSCGEAITSEYSWLRYCQKLAGAHLRCDKCGGKIEIEER